MNDHFLATTALEDFWDTRRPLIFLGDWCKLYTRRHVWQPSEDRTLLSPWRDRERLFQAYQYVSQLYERVLPALADALNSIHGTSLSHRYWRIILGSWLQAYLSAVYDRYIGISEAFSSHPLATTIGLSGESHATPASTLDFLLRLNTDHYNLQLYTRILEGLGHRFPTRPLEPPVTSHPPANSPSLKEQVRKATLLAQRGWLNLQKDRSIILKDSYFCRKDELLLFLKTRGKVWPNISLPSPLAPLPSDRHLRAQLNSVFTPENEFERLLGEFLPQDIPSAFIEGLPLIQADASRNYPISAKAIFSSNSWHYDETFKQWAATLAEHGTLLLGAQHGGNYGSPAAFPMEDHEISITDKYFTWGWSRSDFPTKVLPKLPAPKLSAIKSIGASNNKKGILLVLTTRPRYLVRFPLDTEAAIERLQWHPRFAGTLSDETRNDLTIRVFDVEHGWHIAERWKDFLPSVRIEKTDIPFLESMERCRLYVCDHHGTTYTEALAANKPTILFWNPLLNELRPEASAYFQALRAAGILYDTPEDAAHAVNNIYPDVARWWNDPARQSAREQFCEHFAHTVPNSVDLWAHEFNTLPIKQGNKNGT